MLNSIYLDDNKIKYSNGLVENWTRLRVSCLKVHYEKWNVDIQLFLLQSTPKRLWIEFDYNLIRANLGLQDKK